MPMVPIRIIGYKVNKTKFRTMIITIERINMAEMGTTIMTTTSIKTTMVTKMNEVGHMSPFKIEKLTL